MNKLAPYRKGLVAALGIACQLVAAGLLPPTWQPWGAVVLAAGTAAGVYAIPNRPLVTPAGSDAGHASLGALWRVSGLVGVAVLAGTGGLSVARHEPPCPGGYLQAEVHVGGQRIEAGLDPVTHATVPALVQSQPGDTRYVVALACVRDLSAAERAAQRDGLSVPAEQLPYTVRSIR